VTLSPSGLPTDTPAKKSPAADRIRAAAIAAFSENGYGATSTRDIARRIGLSDAALYPHYDSKEALLYAISLEGHGAALRELRDADRATQTATERLRAVVAAFARWQAQESDLARVLQYELRSLTPEHYQEIVKIRRATSAVIAAVIEAGRSSGEFTAADLAGTLLAISSLCVDVCRWFPSSTHTDPAEVGALYAEIAIRIVA
jgi:AcrR family transcriptional regulator